MIELQSQEEERERLEARVAEDIRMKERLEEESVQARRDLMQKEILEEEDEMAGDDGRGEFVQGRRGR